MELATGTVKRVHLELGGKAPFVVFDDADIEAAANGAVAGALINTGQDCTAATRAYVQRPQFDAFVARVRELMETVRLGDPTDPSTDQGPLVSMRQRQSVHGYVERAVQAGAEIVIGGEIPGGALAGGSYYPPTLVVSAAQDSEIVQEEARRLFTDYQQLMQLGSEYGKFDREGKKLYIERMEEMMERYRVFMKRFELSEDFQAKLTVEQLRTQLGQFGLTPEKMFEQMHQTLERMKRELDQTA